MPRLFLFCIGGTGHRVLKSLLMLFASGVEINAEEVVPVIFDPDSMNGDLDRTKMILEYYNKIHNKLDFKDNKFFKTKVRALSDFGTQNQDANIAGDEFIFDLQGIQKNTFRKYIGLGSLEGNSSPLVKALYSVNNLDTDMTIGFQGSPNIGSVVLNQIKDSHEFITFANNFRAGDRIFIISSIFGGTGAAGFPLLLKNIRNAANIQSNGNSIPNNNLLCSSIIGAVSVLPYFNVQPDKNSSIDSGTFVTKTKAALEYYGRNICQTKSINSLYYVSDNIKKVYPNQSGGENQKNFAHLVEVISATAIIDFMADGNLQNTFNSKTGLTEAVNPKYKEFGVKFSQDSNVSKINFSNFGDATMKIVFKPACQYMYFNLYLNYQLSKSLEKQPWSVRGKMVGDKDSMHSNKLDKNFFEPGSFYRNYLEPFNTYYNDWLVELALNERAFTPFNFDFDIYKEMVSPFGNIFKAYEAKQTEDIFSLVKDFSAEKKKILKDDFVLFDDRLNKFERKFTKESPEQKFFSTFYNATEEIVKFKFKINEERKR